MRWRSQQGAPLAVSLTCNALTHMQAIKFLEVAGSKLDYHRYGEELFDVLIAGGLLGMPSIAHICCRAYTRAAPGGTLILEEEDVKKSPICLFGAANDDAAIKEFAQVRWDFSCVFVRLTLAQIFYMVTRRYKYLQKKLEEEFSKLLLFLKAFSPDDKSKLVKLFAALIDESVTCSFLMFRSSSSHSHRLDHRGTTAVAFHGQLDQRRYVSLWIAVGS